MLTNNSLIKKGEFFILQKRFSERFFFNHLDKNLNSDLLKTSNFSFFTGSSNVLNIKTSIYVLSKLLKEEKRKHMVLTINSSLATLDRLSLKLQASGIYTSYVELKKMKKMAELRARILAFYVICLVKHYKRSKLKITPQPSLKRKKKKKGSEENFFDKRAYKVFYSKVKKNKFCIISKKRRKKKVRSLAILRKRYTRLFNYRLFLFLRTHPIKYKKVLTHVRSDRLKIKRIFFLIPRTKINYVNEKREFYKEYKKLVWKRKKKRNRKKTGLLFFLRRRRRMLYHYHVPRHLEINYKTFDVAHLGQFDLPTTNSRITFWLNLRRLITFLSL